MVPIHSANTGPSPHYFGQGRGVTYLNYTSDQFTGLGGLVIPGTIRDSVYVLEALLEQESGLTPVEIMSDTASYSDLMFGLFWSLGYQFSPRLAEMKETRFWRIDPTADYGPLNGLARQQVRYSRAVAMRRQRWKPSPRSLKSRQKRLQPCLAPSACFWLK